MSAALVFLLSIFGCYSQSTTPEKFFIIEFNESGLKVSSDYSIASDSCFSRCLQCFYFGVSKDSCIGIDVVCQTYKILRSRNFSCNSDEKQEYIESNIDLLLFNQLIYESKNEALKVFLEKRETDILFVFIDEFNDLSNILSKIEYSHLSQVQLVEISLMFLKVNLPLPLELRKMLHSENLKVLDAIDSSELVEFDYSTSINFLLDYKFVF